MIHRDDTVDVKAFLPFFLFIHFFDDRGSKAQESVIGRDFRLPEKKAYRTGRKGLEKIFLPEPDSPDPSRSVFQVRFDHRNARTPEAFLSDIPYPSKKTGRNPGYELSNGWGCPPVFVAKRKTVQEVEYGPVSSQLKFFRSLLPDVGNGMQGRNKGENRLVHTRFHLGLSPSAPRQMPPISVSFDTSREQSIDFELISL
jgi:hypothetical protein